MSTPHYLPSDRVLVTGANGHVAQHLVDQLLSLPAESRPRVRASVRRAETADGILAFYRQKGIYNALEMVVVPDVVPDGAFDAAVQGVTHIAHIASPIILNPVSIKDDLLIPATQGTIGILRSALKEGGVRSVAITSSFASVFDPKHGWRPGYTYTASDFNPITDATVLSPSFDPASYPETWRSWLLYFASKVTVERAAVDFHASSSAPFALSILVPSFIGGPSVLPPPLSRPSISQAILRHIATAPTLPELFLPGWVDARDVAQAHAEALVRGKQGRWLLTAELATNAAVADIIRENFPSLRPSTEVQDVDHYDIDATPALVELGLSKYIGLRQMVVETIAQMLEEQGDMQ